MSGTKADGALKVRAAANRWISDNFQDERKFLTHMPPKYVESKDAWKVSITTHELGGKPVILGTLLINHDWLVVEHEDPKFISDKLSSLFKVDETAEDNLSWSIEGDNYKFTCGDGIEAASKMENRSVDLLLTDPPYGISNPYTCEEQVPRRLRKDGKDFIMPKGHFGNWDYEFNPKEWTDVVLPKVSGWAVIFCAQAQIGEYTEILQQQKFNSVGTLVWHKTNPVPFNHRFKPINAWEAVVVGKRPGTKFNGKAVHNVFTCKSPSPQERIHPTQKPLPLFERFVDLFSSEGNLVFDPFAGSATTVIAALSKKRLVIAYEKDEEFYKSAANRIREKSDEQLF